MTSLRRLILPAVALLVASLFLPERTEGFILSGGSLGEDQRDFRIFDNFADSTANNNTIEHGQFPGYTGAVLAIWKGCIEWSSRLHGDGSGDPTQPGLGDGGSNFDPSFQGLTTSVGGENDNIHSALSGMNGNVLGFMEAGFGGIANGWRIRYYEHWLWHDGPAAPPSGHDLQGIACHEYGHALGLGHTFDGLATMAGGVMATGITNRSIEADDIAGIQAIYGTPTFEKPRIDSVELCAGQLTIRGVGFTSSANEVWFTKSGTGGFGEPVKLTGVGSQSAGTTITVTPPPGAGPGDVLVKRFSFGGVSLSNAYPFNPSNPVCPGALESFCFGDGTGCTLCPCGNDVAAGTQSGCANSTGVGAVLDAIGFPSLASDTLIMSASGAATMSFAILVSADNALPTGGVCPPGSGIVSGNQDGLRCVGGNLLRHGIRATNRKGATIAPWSGLAGPSGFTPGQVRQFQVFYRDDTAAGCGMGQNTSNAIQVTFLP